MKELLKKSISAILALSMTVGMFSVVSAADVVSTYPGADNYKNIPTRTYTGNPISQGNPVITADNVRPTAAETDSTYLFTANDKEMVFVDTDADGNMFVMMENVNTGTDGNGFKLYDSTTDGVNAPIGSQKFFNANNSWSVASKINTANFKANFIPVADEYLVDTNWYVETAEETPVYTTCKIALPSVVELELYNQKIGSWKQAGILDANCLTRSAHFTSATAEPDGGITVSWASGSNRLQYGVMGVMAAGSSVRPVFFIAKDYFKDVHLDVSLMGDSVKEYIIETFSSDEMLAGIVETLKKNVKNYISDYSKVFDVSFASEVNETLKTVEKEVEKITDADTVLKGINTLAVLGDKIIQKGADKELTELDASKTLYQLYKILCDLTDAYIALYDGEMPESLQSDLSPLTDKVNTLYRNDKRLMQYTNEMYRHTKRFYDNAKLVLSLEDNAQKAGVVKGYDLMAGIMIRWTSAFADFETVMRYGIIMQVPYSELISTAGLTQNVNLSTFNFEKESVTGYVKLLDEAGNVAAKTDMMTIDAGTHITTPMSVLVDKKEGQENYYYKAVFYDENDEYVKEDTVVFIIADNVEVMMKPIPTTADKADNLTFSIKNLSTVPFDLRLNIKSNEDVKFAQSSVAFTVDAGKTAEVNVPIASMTNTEYHYYTVEYSLVNGDGNVIYEAIQPINFSCIVKSEDKLDFTNYDGTLDGWEDAYPIYINPPKNSTNSSNWQSSSCSARILYKWDNDNLYMICDAYDNVFLNWLANSDMWNGDCLQMSFDIGNNKSSSYDSNDVEVGFAYTSQLEQFWVWQSPTPYTGSSNVNWSNIIRNEDRKLTRYAAAIPKSILVGINLAAGTKFGYNVGLNDADLT